MRTLDVGGATSHARSAIHEHYTRRPPVGEPQEIDGYCGAAESGTHNDNGSR
jgi:hypothetical protein